MFKLNLPLHDIKIKNIKSAGVSELFRKFYLLIIILPKFISVL